MQLPIIAHRGQVKPYSSIPRINWAHPLARRLVSYGYDIGCGPIDLVTGSQRIVVTTNPPFGGPKASKYGSALTSVAASGVAAAPYTLPGSTDIENITVAAPYSFASGFMLTATPTAFWKLFEICNATSGAGFVIGGDSAAATDLWFAFANTGVINATASGAVKINQYQTGVGVALTSATTACYVDGALSISPAATTTVAAISGSRPTFFAHRSEAAQTTVSGYIYYGALWKGRALTAPEARLLHDDPYCFLIYPEDEIFASLVGASAATAGSNNPVFCIAGDDGRTITQMVGY